MASPANQNQPGGVPFDMNKFFKPSPTPSLTPSTTSTPPQNPNNPNPNHLISSPFSPPSASYPPHSSAGYSFSPQPTTSPFHHHHMPPQFNPYAAPHPQQADNQFTNLQHQQRSSSFPTPPLQPFQNPQSPQNPNAGARLMALLSAPPSTLELSQPQPMGSIQPTTSGGSDFSMPQNVTMLPPAGGQHPGPVRMPSSKLPKGRHLIGDHLVYDIDVRLPGEVQPQLEVTPITKYGSDPGLVLGRQIAVNKTYICYGLKLGAIRVLNINTALRSLLRGLAQRVTDMAFFAEDVHLLASSSVDGRVYVWKISEGTDGEEKPQITERIVVAIQIVGEGQSLHPRVCWHCHKQEVLVVGVGRHVLKVDTTKVGKGVKYSAEEPLMCPIDKLIDGVQLVGEHGGEITDLSMSQWMITRLASASVDGTIKIWEDRKPQPIAVLRPYDGQPVHSVTFLAAPDRPDHIILVTGGSLNREIKIWVSVGEEGWLLPSDAESWNCIQTLKLKSSTEARVEDAFFNQVVALSQAGLLLLANAKKNAIYAVHLDYGPYPAATCMDYMAEFTVTMPILSFTGTSDLLPHGEHIVQVYCVQTQAIQQYALDLLQCLPPPVENASLEKSDSNVSHDTASIEGLAAKEPSRSKPTELSLASSAPLHDTGSEGIPSLRQIVSSASMENVTPQEYTPSSVEAKTVPLLGVTSSRATEVASAASTPLPVSPRLSGKLSGFRSPSNLSDVDRQLDATQKNLSDVASLDESSRNEESKVSPDDVSTALSNSVVFKHPTHLITPSEILMANTSSEVNNINERKNGGVNVQDVVVNDDSRNVEVEVKVVGETRSSQNNDLDSQELHSFVSDSREKAFCSQASDLGIDMARECRALSPETYVIEESTQYDGASGSETLARSSTTQEGGHDAVNDASVRNVDSEIPVPTQQRPASSSKGKKQKGKNAHVSGSSSPAAIAFNSVDSSNEPGVSSSIPSVEATSSQILAMQETLNQIMAVQKDMQKQMSVMVAGPVTKECKRLEAAIGRNMEKAVKANTDALWSRILEENTKQEKFARERTQQITSLITNCISKDLPAVLEKCIKKELAAVAQAVARTITPTIEKTIPTALAEAFQKGVGDKAVNQLEKSVNSRIEAIFARQIQAQFQASGRIALQETLKSTLESSVIPAFEMSCRAMFEQVDATFQKGMTEHMASAQQHFESQHSPLAVTLREAINSASSLTQTLSVELAEGQQKVLAALAVAGANPKAGHPLVREPTYGPLAGLHEQTEAPVDPTKELSRLITERKYEEAFTAALQRSDVSIVSWLCSQVDLQGILSSSSLPLSQGVLLSLLQQLACDVSQDTSTKLSWMTDVISAINPTDPVICVHVRPIFEQVSQILNHRRNLPTTTGAEVSNIRLLMHVINSILGKNSLVK